MNDPKQIYDLYSADMFQDFFEYSPYCRAVGNGNVLEIGVRGGVSTAAFLLSPARHVFSVDIDERCGEIYKNNPRWTFIHSNSQNDSLVKGALHIMGVEQVDVLFIDGLHSYDGLRLDLENYHEMVVPGGLILVHDVAPWNSASITAKQIEDGWAGSYTSRAYNEYLGKHRELRSQVLPGKFGLGIIYK